LRAVVFYGIYKIKIKLFGRYVSNDAIRVVDYEIISDRLQEVGFAEPYAAVYKQRIKLSFARRLSDGDGGATGELIILPYDEVIQSETFI
jgi:hypothetical protein